MQKAHDASKNTYWRNFPDISTPILAEELNRNENSVDVIDDRVVTFDTTKANQTDLLQTFRAVSFDSQTGVFTFTKWNDTTVTVDTDIEKIAINFDYDDNPASAHYQNLVLTLSDGTVKYVDMSALITQYEFTDSSTIAFSISASGSVSASVINGSITEDKLEPNFLANCRAEVAKAEGFAEDAEQSATDSAASAQSAATSATNAGTSERNAAASETAAAGSASSASDSATTAAGAASTATTAAANASASEQGATSAATTATAAAATATTKAGEASTSAASAATSEQNAEGFSVLSESWAVGGTSTRTGEDTNNAKYWAEEAQHAAQGGVTSFNGRTGAVLPAQDDYTIGQIKATGTAGQVATLGENGVLEMQDAGGAGHTIQDRDGTSVTQRDVLKFVDATPSDNSEDESTDITVHRFMTQAEFEALTDAEKYGSIVITDSDEEIFDASMVRYKTTTVSAMLEKEFTLTNQSLSFSGNVATITDSRVTANTFCSVYFNDATLSAASNAGVVVDSGAGTITFTATSAPSMTLVCDIHCTNP